MLNKKQLEKLTEIENHKDFKSRCMKSLCQALRDGIGFDDLATLSTRVDHAYEDGKHASPGRILHNFKVCISFLYKELDN